MNQLKIFLFWVMLLSLTSSIVGQGYAYNPYIGGRQVYCTGPQGPVAFVPNPMHNDIGTARPGNPPTITMNTRILQQLPATLQLFWYGHECAHHVLGHTIGNLTLASETEADCWSIKTLKAQRIATRQDVAAFEPYFARNPGTPWGHLPGPARMQNFLNCFDRAGSAAPAGSQPPPRPQQRGLPNYCCTPVGKLGPYPNPNVPEGGACFGTAWNGLRYQGRACY
jgi:hypothetical protein